GDPLAEVARGAAGADVLVVSLEAEAGRPAGWWGTPLEQLVREPTPALLFARASRRPAGGILVVLERPEGALPALTAAARLAKRSRAPLSILASGAVLAGIDVDAILRTQSSAISAVLPAETIAADVIAQAAHGARL